MEEMDFANAQNSNYSSLAGEHSLGFSRNSSNSIRLTSSGTNCLVEKEELLSPGNKSLASIKLKSNFDIKDMKRFLKIQIINS